MKIGIEISSTRTNQAGTGIYVAQLLHALQSLAGEEHTIQTFSSSLKRFMGNRKTIRSRLDTLFHDLLWTQVILPWKIARSGVDVIHLPANIGPVLKTRPTVVTIHDMALFRYPDYFTPWQRYSWLTLLPIVARRANLIITVSEFSKSEIVSVLGVAPDKVCVVYNGASANFQPLGTTQVERIKQKYALDEFVLVVGTLEPRKNTKRLLQAFAQLKQQGVSHTLVHVGAKGWFYNDILAEIDRLNIKESVRMLGYISLEDLNALYSAAAVAAYPSLYEGFGLPVLEAMQCGCPVVTSNCTSLPEVIGDAGIMVDPYDVDALAKALHRVLADPGLAATLREQGLAQAQTFSWEKCARQTIAAYQKVH